MCLCYFKGGSVRVILIISIIFLTIFACSHYDPPEPTRYGIDYLGGATYPEFIAKHHPDGFSAGFLWKASGWPTPEEAIIGLLQTRKFVPVIRIHMHWRDDHNYDEFFSNLDEFLDPLEKIHSLQSMFPDQVFIVSPFLEHNFLDNDYFLDILRDHTDLPIVNSYLVSPSPNYLNEAHGFNSSPSYIYSTDGVDALEHPYLARESKANFVFLWHPHLNNKVNVNDYTPRDKRKVLVTKELIDKLVEIVR